MSWARRLIRVMLGWLPARLLIEDMPRRLPPRLLLCLGALAATPRRLDPYPGWYFGIDECNPDKLARFRMALWRMLPARGVTGPLTVPWHYGVRLCVYLGNDVSRCLFVGGCMEPNELACFALAVRPGMTVVDAGANEGLYTLLAARRVGAAGVVVAVEPSRRELARLERNVAVNRLRNVRVVRAALASELGAGLLRIAEEEHSGQNTLGAFIYPGVTEVGVEEVELVPLDVLTRRERLGRVDVVKMDVEGSELKVIEGGRNTIRQYRPLLFLELSDEAPRREVGSAADVLGALEEMGYRWLTYDETTGRPVTPDESHPMTSNIVAWHPGRPWPGVLE